MKQVFDESRRDLLKKVALGTVLIPIAGARFTTASAADLPLVSTADPTASALKYVEDVAKASAAKPGSKCANCALYQGAAGSAQGPCLLFPGKAVKSGGWCSSWTKKT
ncbi:MAG TPA: high-potential iron-sulfur protein [Steroidobacteraceae bacterium]|nr:high-potential iron-sulfur protein [Steroidobacteraceae bacterium]